MLNYRWAQYLTYSTPLPTPTHPSLQTPPLSPKTQPYLTPPPPSNTTTISSNTLPENPNYTNPRKPTLAPAFPLIENNIQRDVKQMDEWVVDGKGRGKEMGSWLKRGLEDWA